MGVYLTDNVVTAIEITNSLIKRELTDYEDERLITDGLHHSDEEFFKICLLNAWNVFYQLFTHNKKLLDDNTPFNQENIPEYITFSVGQYSQDKISFLSDLLRVLYEFHFWTGRLKNPGAISHDVLTELMRRGKKSKVTTAQFQYIRDELSLSLTKWLLNSPNFLEAKTLIHEVQSKKESFIEEVTTRKVEYLNEIYRREEESIKNIGNEFNDIKHDIQNGKEKLESEVKSILSSLSEVEALEMRVGNLKSEYNFVGLSSGFNKIKEKKESELRDIAVNYKNLFGCIFIVPVILSFLHLFQPTLFPKDYTILFLVLPFFTIEMALIYFFRLSYLEAKSIRTQLVQIELRLSLCSFIDGYVDYRKKNNVNIDKVLDNFDALIFSPIQTNENNIPSMFDGVEAIAGLAEKITKKQ